MSTILLVEDDISLANWVSEFLTEQNFTVIHLARGDLVLDKIKAQTIDLVLLDVMLPGLNGIEVCRLIRQHCQVPIIMLTARADEYDEVIGLEAGADDYVIKPVRPRALLARITRQLSNQQQEASSSNIITFGELTINQEAKRVTFFDQEIELSSSLFAFLTFLAERAGSVVDRDSVFLALRKREYDGLDRRFDVMLSSLRKVFNDDPLKPRKFKTIWGKGYLFVGDAWGKDSQVEQIQPNNKQED